MRRTDAICGETAVIVKLVGSAVMLLCGALYAKNAQKNAFEELAEAERLLEVFKYVKNEIEEFDTPLYVALKSRGIEGGIDGLMSQISFENLRKTVSEAKKIGRGYKKEDLRVFDRVVSRLEDERKKLEAKAREAKVISRVKGIGISAAAVILFL